MPATTQAIAVQRENLSRLEKMLKAAEPAFAKIAGKYIVAERVARIVMAAARRPPKYNGAQTIADCDPKSILLAVMEAVQVGIEPETPFHHAYLIPYAGQCTLQFGYPGLQTLALRQPEIKRLITRIVYAKDQFSLRYMPEEVVEHTPSLSDDPGEMILAYAVARLDGNALDVEPMRPSQIRAIRDRIKSADRADSPWNLYPEQMWRKTVLKRGCTQRWSFSQDLARAVSLDSEYEVGEHAPDVGLLDIVDAADPKPVSTPNRAAEVKERATRRTAAPKPPAEESTTPPPADAPPPPAPAPSSEPDWAAEAQATLDAIAAAESDDALNAIWPSVVLHKADRPDVYKKLEAAWKLRRRELKAAAKAAEVRRWIVKCGDAYLGYVSAAGYGSACDEAGHLWPGAEITVIDVAEASEAQLLAADEAEKLAAQNATQA